jgi:hypothetical protein
MLLKSFKNCERNMHILTKVQAKGICNIFNKIITEYFPNLKRILPIQVQETSRTPNQPNQNRTSQRHISIETTSTENTERILKAVREKKQHRKVNP